MSLIGSMATDRTPLNPGIELRRAVLGLLLLERRSMSVDELLQALTGIGCEPQPCPPRTPRKALADVLAYQCRLGRVRRIRRGTYAAVPGAMSASMRSRSQSVVRNSSTVRSNASEEAAAS